MSDSLTRSQVLSGIADVMGSAGYVDVEIESLNHLNRVFEDEYGIVAAVVYPTWESLSASWPDAQGELVELLSGALARSDPKSWEGYLVLVTPGFVDQHEDARELSEIRRDIQRVRKIVITGAEIPSISAVTTALLPVLPLRAEEATAASTGLMDVLPQALEANSNVPAATTAALISAFLENEPLMEAIDREVGRS